MHQHINEKALGAAISYPIEHFRAEMVNAYNECTRALLARSNVHGGNHAAKISMCAVFAEACSEVLSACRDYERRQAKAGFTPVKDPVFGPDQPEWTTVEVKKPVILSGYSARYEEYSCDDSGEDERGESPLNASQHGGGSNG